MKIEKIGNLEPVTQDTKINGESKNAFLGKVTTHKEIGRKLDKLCSIGETRSDEYKVQKNKREQSKSEIELLSCINEKLKDTNTFGGLDVLEREKIYSIIDHHYERAIAIVKNATKDGLEGGVHDDTGQNFTDHNENHIEQVVEKTTEALNANVMAINAGKMEKADAVGDVHFSSDVDYKVTQAAALSHDTGMSDDGYSMKFENKKPVLDSNGNYVVEKQNPLSFNQVRENHSANSALNVLQNRNQYKEAGFSDHQVDEIAMLTYEHSKSSSGIRNLNESKSWKEGFNRMDAFVDAYNKDHPENPISYDRNYLKSRVEAMATEGLALRVGDVSRNSGPDALAQSGEVVHVEKDTVKSGNSYMDEIKGAVVVRGDKLVEHPKSKQVHIGEQNIVDNHTEFKGGKLVHTITVADGNYAPYCTAEAIKDHVGEFASAKNGDFTIEVYFNEQFNDMTKSKYDTFRKLNQEKFPNVHITYPWDGGKKNGKSV